MDVVLRAEKVLIFSLDKTYSKYHCYKHYYEQIDGKTIDITEEIPFELPNGWVWCRLHEVCAENSVGIVIRPTQYYTTSDKGIPAFRNANIKPNKIDDTNWIYLSYYGIQENPRCIVHENNLLISRSGNAGTCCVATKKYDGYGAVDILLISLSSFCSSFFISYCINSPFFQHKISQNNRGVALSHIGTNTVAKILLPLPPLAEQKRIVGQIENLLKCADEIDRESTTLEKSLVLAKQKVLDLAIRGKLVPQNPEDEPASELLKRIKAEKEALVKAGKIKRDRHESYIFRGDDNRYYQNIANSTEDITNEIPFPIPEKWAWTTLGFIIEVERGGSPRPIEDYLTDDPTGLNWIKIGDVSPGSKYIEHTREKIKPAGLSKTRFVHEGDFLLSNSMSFGRPYILKISGCIHDGWLVLHLNPAVIKQDFLFWILSSNTVYSWLANKASGSTVKNLKSDSVRLIYFPLPPLAEQRRIAEVAEQYMSILESVG